MPDHTPGISLDASTDEELMTMYCAGHDAAFTVLYGRYKDPLYGFVRRSLSDESQVAETFQDVWMRVIQHRESFDQNARFSTWLYTITRRRIIDRYRQQQTGAAVTDDWEDDRLPDSTIVAMPLTPDEVAQFSEDRLVLQATLNQLPPLQRECLLMRHILGMSLPEIAEATGVKRETVKSRLRYASAELRNLLRSSHD